MKAGETICYYRARGGEKSIYITMLYDKDRLRGSIVQSSSAAHKKGILSSVNEVQVNSNSSVSA